MQKTQAKNISPPQGEKVNLEDTLDLIVILLPGYISREIYGKISNLLIKNIAYVNMIKKQYD